MQPGTGHAAPAFDPQPHQTAEHDRAEHQRQSKVDIQQNEHDLRVAAERA